MATSRTNLALGHMGKGNSQTPMMFIVTLTNLMVRQPQNEAFLILRVSPRVEVNLDTAKPNDFYCL